MTIWMRPAAAVGVLSRFVLSVARPSGSEPLDPPLPAYNLPPRPSTCATHHPNSRSFGPTSRGPATILAPIRPNSSRRRPSIGCEPDPPARRLLRRVFLSQTPRQKPRSRRDVAEHFVKRHDNVLRDIDELLHSSDVRDGWLGKPGRNPKKTRTQPFSTAPWVKPAEHGD